MKNIIITVKNSVNGTLDKAEKRINKLEDESEKTIHIVTQTTKR